MQLIHGGDLVSCQTNYPGVPVLDFSANINPLGLAPGVEKALAGTAAVSVHYPDPLCRELRAALSRFEGKPAEQILCGGGAADLIYRLAFGLRPKTALLPAPTFAEYALALAAAGCKVTHLDLAEGSGFALDEGILDALDGAEIVFLCNPNNPTGRVTDRRLMERILARCREAGATLVVDECFLDFLEDGEKYSMKPLLGEGEKLVILRAFTKIFAIQGLRLGYALCGNKALLARIEAAGPPWAVSAPAQLCGCAAVEETAYLRETRRVVALGRAQLEQGLAALGCTVYPSAANYLMFRARPGLAADLMPKGILLRNCENYRGLCPGYYRTAVRTKEENKTLLEAIQSVI